MIVTHNGLTLSHQVWEQMVDFKAKRHSSAEQELKLDSQSRLQRLVILFAGAWLSVYVVMRSVEAGIA